MTDEILNIILDVVSNCEACFRDAECRAVFLGELLMKFSEGKF